MTPEELNAAQKEMKARMQSVRKSDRKAWKEAEAKDAQVLEALKAQGLEAAYDARG